MLGRAFAVVREVPAAARRVASGVLAAGVMLSVGNAAAAVFGEDTRRDVPQSYAHMAGQIGMIYEPDTQTLCSAFCVAPNVVATASHCLFQPRKGRLPNLFDMSFRLEYRDLSLSSGIAGRMAGTPKHSVAVGTTRFGKEPPLSAPKDWALAKLERPICKFGTMNVSPRATDELIEASRERRIFQLSYHWDYTHWKLAYSDRCKIRRSFKGIEWRYIRQHFSGADDLLLHDCDTGGASSGSPILMDTTDGPVVVGLNVGTYTRTRLLLSQGDVVRRQKPDIIANTAVNVRAFAPVIGPLATRTMISTEREVIDLQKELQARNLYTGPIDGIFGRGTRSAIRAYESLRGETMTGLPTRLLLTTLITEGAGAAIEHQNVREWAVKPFD
ncbi:protease YdgD [Dichotomicrobium thermohalophilum]|uniref:Protease YdgD n=1 Tax=Dichotomicrobium thermohalophilum TaxID=933063 RepID=A0A397Q1B7_9HYPH|nr:protease YdgD [Dichotomicrobium thermohalophilum]